MPPALGKKYISCHNNTQVRSHIRECDENCLRGGRFSIDWTPRGPGRLTPSAAAAIPPREERTLWPHMAVHRVPRFCAPQLSVSMHLLSSACLWGPWPLLPPSALHHLLLHLKISMLLLPIASTQASIPREDHLANACPPRSILSAALASGS